MADAVDIRWNSTPHARWEALADQAAAPMTQRWTHGAAWDVIGATVDRAEVRVNGKPVALAQFINRRFAGLVPYALCSRGPVWLPDTPEAGTDRILQALRAGPPGARRAAVLITPPLAAMADDLTRAGLNPVMTPGTLAQLDLRGGPDAIRRAMHQKWRNRLTAAEKEGFKVFTDTGALDWLSELERRQQLRRGYRNYPAAFFRAWASLDPKGTDLRILSLGEQPVAAMLTLVHGRTATYQMGWSGPEGRAAGAHGLLLWSLVQALCDRGVEVMDLGIIDTERAPGLARFKLGSGANPVVLGGTHMGWRGAA